MVLIIFQVVAQDSRVSILIFKTPNPGSGRLSRSVHVAELNMLFYAGPAIMVSLSTMFAAWRLYRKREDVLDEEGNRVLIELQVEGLLNAWRARYETTSYE